MTKIQRVKRICKWLIFIDFADNDTDLAKKLGYTKSSFSQIMNEKVPLSDKFINAIVNTNKNINIVWINEEQGEMLRSSETLPTDPALQQEIERLKEENSELKSKLIACYEKLGGQSDFTSKAS